MLKLEATFDDLLFLFHVLCVVERTGTAPDSQNASEQTAFARDLTFEELRTRVEFLGNSLGLIPSCFHNQLAEVADIWRRQMSPGTDPPLSELRSKPRAELLQPLMIRPDGFADPPPDQIAIRRKVNARLESIGLNPCTTDDGSAQLSDDDLSDIVSSWLWTLETDRWRTVPGIVEGDILPLKEIYVDLYAVPEREAHLESDRQGDIYTRFLTKKRALLAQEATSVRTLLLQLRHRTLLIGEPGAGKSTIVKWIVTAIVDGLVPEFFLPFAINLGHLAYVVEQSPDSCDDLFSYFCKYGVLSPENDQTGRTSDVRAGFLEMQEQEQGIVIGDGLRNYVRSRNDVLFVLDGWDEVPPAVRTRVRAMIERDTVGIATIITSRPSGLPKQLLGTGADIYELARMRSEAAVKLARRYFEFRNRPDLVSGVEDELASDSSGFATNPFLLTLRCALAEDDDYRSLIGDDVARPEVYERCIRLLLSDTRVKLGLDTVERLTTLAEEKLFNSDDRPFYSFSGTELERAIESKTDTLSLVRSRLLQSVDDPLSDAFRLDGMFAYTHASFAEYLAARQISQLPIHPSQSSVGLDVAREEVVRFLLDMSGVGADAVREGFRSRCRAPDRYRHVFVRLARMLVDTKLNEPVVLEELWKLACNDDTQLEMLRDVVLLLYKIDGEWFINKCMERPNEPLEVARQWIVMYFDHHQLPWSHLESLVDLGNPWEDYVYLAKRPEDSSSKAQSLPELIRQFQQAPTSEAAIVLGQMRNEAAVQALAANFHNPDPEIAEQSAYAVATIKGIQASETLVAGLLDPPESVGAGPFLNSLRWYGMKALTPDGKQRIMRRIAALPPTDAQVIDLLKAIAGLPVRSGAELLASLFKLESVSDQAARQGFSEQRALVAEILGHCEIPKVVSELLANAIDETDTTIRSGVFGIAYGSGIPSESYDVILTAVLQESDIAARVAALSALVNDARNSTETTHVQGISQFLLEQLDEVTLETEIEWLAKVLSSADVAGEQAVPKLERHLCTLRATAKSTTDGDQVFEVACTSVAGSLANVASLPTEPDRERNATRVLQSVVASLVDGPLSEGEAHLLQACLGALVAVSPGDVLFYVDHSVPADKALREWSAKTGNLVIGSDIFDPYGNLIATRSDAIGYDPPFRRIWDYATSIGDKKQLVTAIEGLVKIEDEIRQALGSHRSAKSLAVSVSFAAAIRNQNRKATSLQRELALLLYIAENKDPLRRAVESVANIGAIPADLHKKFSQRGIANALGVQRKEIQNLAVLKAIAVAFRLGKHASAAKDLAGKFASSEMDADTMRMTRIFENENLQGVLELRKLTALFELAKSRNWNSDELLDHISTEWPNVELDED